MFGQGIGTNSSCSDNDVIFTASATSTLFSIKWSSSCNFQCAQSCQTWSLKPSAAVSSKVRVTFRFLYHWQCLMVLVSNSHISRAILRHWCGSSQSRHHPSLNQFVGSLASQALSLHFLCPSISSVDCSSFATPSTFSFSMYLSSPRCRNTANIRRLWLEAERLTSLVAEHLHSVSWCIFV